ncbi:hypothetical protein H9Y04_24650 [Streptomyces sp. TRM66268-LWL]|uniref:Uncharacterized protein n=1 Tax=Streptomyces polyasparticus TaxID=2767826 RepID=A0ABR7SMB8_9ACTN|nr:hypothetical protein [Streptomyces polyasparticus]MBC9715737.1 hypothetical protein [Streptomyces polyasparticus]
MAAIATGPLAPTVTVMAPSPTVSAAPKPTPVTVPVAPADLTTGYTEMFPSAWLRSSDKQTDAQSHVVQTMARSVALPDRVEDAQPVSAVHAVRSTQHRDSRGSVTAAAQYTDGTVRTERWHRGGDQSVDEVAGWAS